MAKFVRTSTRKMFVGGLTATSVCRGDNGITDYMAYVVVTNSYCINNTFNH